MCCGEGRETARSELQKGGREQQQQDVSMSGKYVGTKKPRPIARLRLQPVEVFTSSV